MVDFSQSFMPDPELARQLAELQSGRPQAPGIDADAVKMQLMDALMRQRTGQSMMTQPYRPYGAPGWGSVIAAIAQPFIGRKMAKNATAELAEALGKQGDLKKYDDQIAQSDAEIKRIRDQIDEQRKAWYAESIKDRRTPAMKEADALNLQGPEREAFIRNKGSTQTNIYASKGTPFEQAADKKGADLYSGMQEQIASIPKLEVGLQAMENIAKQFETGRIENVQAAMGAWLGTDAGAARDVWNSQLTPLKLELAKAISGPMTEGEWAMLEKALPNFGSDPEATATVIRLIRKGMTMQMDNYDSATNYVEKNGHLRGWKPPHGVKEYKPTGVPEEDDPLGILGN